MPLFLLLQYQAHGTLRLCHFEEFEEWGLQIGTLHFDHFKPIGLVWKAFLVSYSILRVFLGAPEYTGTLSIEPKFSVQPVEMLIQRADQTEIFRNKRTKVGGTRHFPFQQKLPSICTKFTFSFCCLLIPSLCPVWVFYLTDEIASLEWMGKRLSFDMESFRYLQTNIYKHLFSPGELALGFKATVSALHYVIFILGFCCRAFN